MIEPRCSERKCKHFIGVRWMEKNQEKSEVVVCSAFPKGISEKIAYGRDLHIEPVEGDHNIQFEVE